MRKKELVAISVCLAAFLGASSGTAIAGEVAGPPQSQDPKSTGAPDNANSNCAYSGLNDYDPAEGQSQSIVQTVADAWKYYGLPPGFPGTSGACHGGTNEGRDK